jgi:Asp-tRNA(Asn)/Glu-tRNA(Gln) amidotransferase C subunit
MRNFVEELKKVYSYKGFEMKRETYFKFIEMKEQISKEDMEDILDMAEQLNDFEQAFNDYVEAIN